MNFGRPLIICHQNEDFRLLLREMLTKHGFFHVLEANSQDELRSLLAREEKPHFILIQADLVDAPTASLLAKRKDFIVLSRQDEDRILPLAARLGVGRFLSFPFSSQTLLEKIQSSVQ